MTSHPRNQFGFLNRTNQKQPERVGKGASHHPPTNLDYSDFVLSENNYDTENECRESDERSSIESLSLCDVSVNPDGNGDVDQRYRDYAPETKRDKLTHEVPYPHYQQETRVPDYLGTNYPDYRPNTQRKIPPTYGEKKAMYEPGGDPQAALAMQKLQKLRELQRRRDLTEKYYSNEIRRLIGEQYYEAKIPSPVYSKPIERPYMPNYAGDRAMPIANDQNLEPCGTMTTLTRLDCGCVERTLRPIFTTPSGQVLQKHSCSPDQPYNHVRMSTPNARLFVPHPRHRSPPGAAGQSAAAAAAAAAKLRSKSFGEQYQTLGAAGAFASGSSAQPTITTNRGVSPARKRSDSTVQSA